MQVKFVSSSMTLKKLGTRTRYAGALYAAGEQALSVPAYRLYGENYSQSAFGFFHIEPLSIRNVPNNWRIRPHSHPDLDQLSIVLEGKCVFRHDGREIVVGSPSCVFTPANVVHEFSYEPNAKGCVISVSSDFASGLPSVEGALNTAVMRLSTHRLVRLSSRQVVDRLVELLSIACQSTDGRRRDTLRYLLGCLLLELDREAACQGSDGMFDRSTGGGAELYRQFQELLRLVIGSLGFSKFSLRQPHTIESFAERLSTTPYALNAACRKVSGLGAQEIVQNAILEHATRLLLYSDIPIKELAFVLGYSHASHFARFFKKNRATSPERFRSEFRQKWSS
jgi:AraC family transcriptional regulator, transcriptional activator of pobA